MDPNLGTSIFLFIITLIVLYIYEITFVLKKDEKVCYTQFFFEKGAISFILGLSLYVYNSKAKDNSITESVHVNTFDD